MKLIVFRCPNLFFLHWKKNLLRDERDELRDNQRKHRYTVECMYVYRRHFGSGDDTYTLTHLQIAKLSIYRNSTVKATETVCQAFYALVKRDSPKGDFFYTQGPLFCALVREEAIFAVCKQWANEGFACMCKENNFFFTSITAFTDKKSIILS